MGHVQQTDAARNTKKIYQANLHQKRPNGRPKARGKYDVENGIREMEIVKWIQLAQDRDGWRRASRKAHILSG